MRNLIKGGMWKNIEDEILKAAVMKYGLNQWSRISSLLVRKSAKQCKARWYEWLDPSIKKTEWSKEEEEKLLHLAKLFPNQWRTIAPGIGRTASQCIEHYEKLLEEAAGKEIDQSEDPRQLKPGEVDPAPETRPPRPDPVDMDEDEKEMLQEARARLSNTRGKKAKRKMREKQLEEGRRLATVQRKRELRASGIEMELKKRIKPKVREMDYNVEIPFEHMVPEGKFKLDEATLPSRDQLMISAQHIEGSMRSEQEAKRKVEDEHRMKRLKELNLPAAITKINDLNEFKVPMKRSRLVLPRPQLTEIEIQNYSKMVLSEGSSASDILVSNTEKTQALVNPDNIITPQGESTVHLEAYNAFLISNSSTPLVGGFNQPLLMPTTPAMTPNKIARSLTPNLHGLNLGTEEIQAEKAKEARVSYLEILPKPENEYEMEEEEESEEKQDAEESEEIEENEEIDLKSAVVKKGLPRPYVFNPKKYAQGLGDDGLADEIVNLVLYDMHQYPMKGGKTLPLCVDKELLDYESLKKAEKLVQEHLVGQESLPDFEKIHNKFTFDYSTKSVLSSHDIPLSTALASASINLKYSSSTIEKLNQKCEVLQESVKNKTKDLQSKAHKLESSIKKKLVQREKLQTESCIFQQLQSMESSYLQQRLSNLRGLLKEEQEKEYFLTKALERTTSEIDAWEWCNNT